MRCEIGIHSWEYVDDASKNMTKKIMELPDNWAARYRRCRRCGRVEMYSRFLAPLWYGPEDLGLSKIPIENIEAQEARLRGRRDL